MTIGGSFDAKTSAVSGSLTSSAAHPPAFDGSLAVDLRTLDTGISLRNDHLREKYLEVDKGAGYDKAVLSDIDLKGLNPDAPEGKGSFTGSLTLHGVTKTVAGPVEVKKTGSGLRVKASFPVNLPDYNIPEPRYLGVGVKNTVQVEVTFTATQ
jgi:polyisoprenoid-binding protein YceI